MHIKHIAIWVADIEKLKEFYVRYFKAKPGAKYENSKKGFSSYFLDFESGAQLEIMRMDSITEKPDDPDKQFTGYAHLAMSAGSEECVNSLTAELTKDGYVLLDGPRMTGDGYYESVVLDPEGNKIEITV